MRVARFAVPFVLVLGLTACDESEDPTMPDVVGQQLDAALVTIEAAGITREPNVEGGGLFGVVDEANWQVCSQVPAGGAAAPGTPELIVERDCDGDAEETAEPEPEPEESEEEVETSETATASAEPEEPAGEENLTIENNEDFAALAVITDTCSSDIGEFAAKYQGRNLEFDGYIGAMANHGDYDTRYDFLVNVGDFSETSSPGPNFKYRDVSAFDLNLEGDDAPDYIGVGDNLHFVAEIREFKELQCLLLLDPVSTQAR